MQTMVCAATWVAPAPRSQVWIAALAQGVHRPGRRQAAEIAHGRGSPCSVIHHYDIDVFLLSVEWMIMHGFRMGKGEGGPPAPRCAPVDRAACSPLRLAAWPRGETIVTPLRFAIGMISGGGGAWASGRPRHDNNHDNDDNNNSGWGLRRALRNEEWNGVHMGPGSAGAHERSCP